MGSNELKDFQYYHIKALKERIKQLENELERIKHVIIQN
jgi:uncharacterized small protein (DUF1192 family)